MRKFNHLFGIGAGILAMGLATTAQADLKRITIGSNKQGSVFFLLASGFAKTFQQQLKIRATAQPHAGSSVYLPLIDNGEITMGLNNSMDSGAIVRGKAPFRIKAKNVRAIARVWIIPYGFMVKASSNIKSVADLRGKKVVTKVSAIVSLSNLNLAILKGAGITIKDITPMTSGGIVKNISMVIEGRADAAALAPGMPAVRKAHAATGIRFIPLASGTSDASLAIDSPGARTFVQKPLKRYPFITQPTRITAFDAYLNAGKQVSSSDAYKFAKVLHTQWKNLQKVYGPLRGTKQDKIAPPTAPHLYHPGAVKYYKEAGIWSAANDKQQAKVRAEIM